MSMEEPDFYNMIARERGMPDGWRWYQLEARPKVWAANVLDRAMAVVLVRGAVCTAVFTRGPRKGRPNWNKRDRATDCEIVISLADYDARAEAWRAEQERA